MKEKMKGLWTEFKKFISRGNVVDMAIGVVIGTAFTAIVNAVTKGILMPLVNWALCLLSTGRSSPPPADRVLKVCAPFWAIR